MSTISNVEENNKPIKKYVDTWGIVLVTIFQILITLLLGYALLAFWPADFALVEQAAQPTKAHFFGAPLLINGEVRMLILIGLIGALGAQVRTLRSVYWYIGNRDLVWSWVVMYFLVPFAGAILGLMFYLVIRAGFFSTSATINDSNPIGFLALAGLVGMFSEQAVLKLKDVFEVLMTSPPPGDDSTPQEGKAPPKDEEAESQGEEAGSQDEEAESQGEEAGSQDEEATTPQEEDSG